jgi:hypothetical protein
MKNRRKIEDQEGDRRADRKKIVKGRMRKNKTGLTGSLAASDPENYNAKE